MHHAPAVRVSCAGGGPWAGVHLLLYALAAASLLFWLLMRLGSVASDAMPVALLAGVAAAALAWRGLRFPACTLEWSGVAWRLELNDPVNLSASSFELTRVDVMMDLTSALLLRLNSPQLARGGLWLVVRQCDLPYDFRVLCIALYAQSVAAPARQAL